VEGTVSPLDKDEDIEYWTEKINGVGQISPALVCNSYSELRDNKDLGDWVW
jgi:hypothetical protein